MLTFPDRLILQNGKKMRCEIVSETGNSVKIETDTGKATMFRKQIADIEYATEQDKELADRARSEIAEAEARMDELKSRIAELQPPEETEPYRKRKAESDWPDITVEGVSDPNDSGNHVAIMEVDGRRRIAREGYRMGAYEVVSMDKEYGCVTIENSESGETQEFCKE